MESKKEDEKVDKTEEISKQETVPRRSSIELQKIEPKASVTVTDSNAPEKPARQSYPRPEIIYAPRRTQNWMSCLKFGLIAFNSLIWLLGGVILAVGIWVAVDPDFWNLRLNLKDVDTSLDLKDFSAGAYVAIALGIIILLIGLIGCCGAYKESVCCLAVYLAIAIIILLMEAAAMGIVWSATNSSEMKEEMRKVIKKGISEGEKEPHFHHFITLLQHKLECCGVEGPGEYNKQVPDSCRDPDSNIYEKGCLDKMLEYLKSKAAIIGGIAVVTLLLQVGAIVCTICLICALRQGSKQVF